MWNLDDHTHGTAEIHYKRIDSRPGIPGLSEDGKKGLFSDLRRLQKAKDGDLNTEVSGAVSLPGGQLARIQSRL